MKLCALLLSGYLTLAGAAFAASPDTRFSQTLTTSEQQEMGITRLSSDQVAVLDALVRRDAGRMGETTDKPAPTFSQRLTPAERTNTGLTLLSAAEIARIDGRVVERAAGGLARSLLAPPTYISRPRIVTPSEAKAEREIHGSFSLSYGWGKGGYSEKTGSMVLRMDDPEHRYSIMIGYSESQIKGPGGGYYYRDDLALPHTMLPDPLSPSP